MSTNLQTNYTVNMSQPAAASLLNTISESDGISSDTFVPKLVTIMPAKITTVLNYFA